MKDDWLIPVIVGSVLGGLVIVVVVAYVIGRRRQIEDENQESVENENYSDWEEFWPVILKTVESFYKLNYTSR